MTENNKLATTPSPFAVESLESRTLLSGSHGSLDFGGGRFIGPVGAIDFSAAPAAVQAGLNALASTDGAAAPADTDAVFLGNSGGMETYSIKVTGTGTVSKLTVDVAGAPVTPATRAAATYADVPAATSSEVAKIADALGLTAPASTDDVVVVTPATGPATYTVRLTAPDSPTTTTTDSTDSTDAESLLHRARDFFRGRVVTVDADGNPAGNQRLPAAAFSSAVIDGLNAGVPDGATPLAADATTPVSVRTANGVTTYSAVFTATGTRTTVTVLPDGSAAALPTRSSVAFSDVPSAAATELQSLVTDKGGDTIAADAKVTAFDEANGTVIYTLNTTYTTAAGRTRFLTVSSDQDGNPTVPPSIGFNFGGFGGLDFGPFHFGGFGGFGHHGLGH